jgi:hypothetical protein
MSGASNVAPWPSEPVDRPQNRGKAAELSYKLVVHRRTSKFVRRRLIDSVACTTSGDETAARVRRSSVGKPARVRRLSGSFVRGHCRPLSIGSQSQRESLTSSISSSGMRIQFDGETKAFLEG